MTTIIKLSKWVGAPLFLIYLIAMVAYPFFSGNWVYVQGVWERWQGLNVGVLAFTSSLIALNISRYNAEKQRSREFRAAQASLPLALNELCDYTEAVAQHYKKAWNAVTNNNAFDASLPELKTSFEPVFSECIKHARPEVGEWLAGILTRLQIHRARAIAFTEELKSSNRSYLDKHKVLDHMYSIGELRASIDRIFPLARGQKALNVKSLELQEFYTAYSALKILPENYSFRFPESDKGFDLQVMTEERVEG